jgi:hypothetical protein
MGDKGFIEKNFQLMKDTMETDKERAEVDEQDGTEDVPGARRKKGGGLLAGGSTKRGSRWLTAPVWPEPACAYHWLVVTQQ